MHRRARIVIVAVAVALPLVSAPPASAGTGDTWKPDGPPIRSWKPEGPPIRPW